MKLETYALHKPVKNKISQCKEQCSNEEQDSRAQTALAWINETEAEASYLLLFGSPTNSQEYPTNPLLKISAPQAKNLLASN